MNGNKNTTNKMNVHIQYNTTCIVYVDIMNMLYIFFVQKRTCSQLLSDCVQEGSLTSTASMSSWNEGTGYMSSKEASLYASFVVNALTPRKSADPLIRATSSGESSDNRDLGKPCSALLYATFFFTALG